MAASQHCPFCLGEIPIQAEACLHCARDVGMLLRARARIVDLESELAKSQPTTLKQRPSGWGIRVPMWSFYTISVWAVLGASMGWHHWNPEFVIAGLALVTGVMTMALVPTANIWMLFLTGFAQPLVGTAALVLTGRSHAADLKGLLPSFFGTSLTLGLSAAFGAIAAALLGRQRLSAEQYSFSVFLDWIDTANSRLDRIEHLTLKIAALISTATLVLSRLFP